MADSADILLKFGALGQYAVDGTSGALIKRQLEAQLRKGIQIKVGIDNASLKAVKAQLDSIGHIKIQPTGIEIGAIPGAAISTKPMSQETAALTAARIANMKAIHDENLAAQKQINTEKIAIEQGKARAQELETEIKLYRLKEQRLKADEAALKQKEQAEKRNTASTKQAASETAKIASVTARATSTLSGFNQYLQTVKPTALKEVSAEILNIRSNLLKAQNSGSGTAFDDANNQIKALKAHMKDIGAEGGNIFTYLQGKIKTFAVYLASSALTMGFVSGFKNAVSVVIDLNDALTDLRIITGKNDTQAKELLSTYNQIAQKLGSTTRSVAQGAQDWLRQGYSLQDTNELIKQSMALSIMGDMPSADATTSLTAAMKGYRLEVSQASEVVDKFFAVDMAAATSSSKLAEALAKTAANAKLAGLDLNDVIGQLAVVNETMQEGGEETGTFYNTMLSRMGNIKAGRLEDPESGDSLSDVETTLGGLDIKLRKSETEFRNFGDVLDEVAERWDSFSSVQQRAIATAFAGTRQQTRFLALMQGYQDAAKYSETAADSLGVSAQKMEIYEGSLEAKTNRLNAAFENMSTSLIPSELIGSFLDAGTAALNFGAELDGIPVTIAAVVASLFTLVTAFTAIKNSSLGTSIKSTLSIVPNFINTLNATSVAAQALAATQAGAAVSSTQLAAAFSVLTPSQIINSVAVEKLTEDQIQEVLITSTLTAEQKDEILNHYLSATAKTVDGAATKGLTIDMAALTAGIWANVKAIAAWLVTNPVGWCILAIGAIAGLVKLHDALTISLEEQHEATEKLRSEYADIESQIDSYNSKLDTTQSRIAELLNKGPLSFTEQEELERLKKQNEYLRTQIELQEQIRVNKAKELNASLEQEFQMDYGNGVEYHSLYNTQEIRVSKHPNETATIASYVDAQGYYLELLQKIKELSTAPDYDSEELEKYRAQLLELSNGYADYASRLEVVDDESQNLYNAWMDLATAGQNVYKGIFWSADAETSFKKLWSGLEFKNTISALKELAYEGEVTAAVLSKPAYADFIKRCEELGLVGGESGITLEALASHINSLGESAADGAQSVGSLTDALSRIETSRGVLKGILGDIEDSGNLSLGTLQKILDTYPELEDAVGLYSAGILSSADILDLIQKKYDEDVENYSKLIVAKNQASSTFYSNMLRSNQQWVSEFAKKYGIDLENYKSLAQAKLAIEKELLGSVTGGWKQFYNAQTNALSEAAGHAAMAASLSWDEEKGWIWGEPTDPEKKQTLATIQALQTYIDALSEMNSISLDTVFSGIDFSDSASKSGKASLYIAEIDALYESTLRLKDVQNEMSTLEAKNNALSEADYRKKIENSKEIIRLRGEENRILNEQNTIRRSSIQAGIGELVSYGFKIDYDPASNDLLIKNMEHINDLVAPSGKVEDTNKLRKAIEALIEKIRDYNDDAIEASLQWHENFAQNKKDTEALTDAVKQYYDAWESDQQHEIDMMTNQGGQSDKIIAAYYTMMDQAHAAAEEIRALMRERGFTEAEIEHSDAIQALESSWYDYYNSIKSLQQERLDSLNEELDLVKDMIKQEKEDEIDALEAQADAYAEIIRLKKESLELTERERTYNEQVGDLNKEISKLQARADALALDDSRSAQLERGSILEELADKQKELADLQHDHSIEQQRDALDQEQKDFESAQDKKIKEIKDFLADNQKLTQAAMDRIESSGASLFDELKTYALKYTDTTETALVEMWEKAKEAAEGYASFADALAQTEHEANNPSTNGSGTGDSGVSDAYKINQMKQNSAAWHGADKETQNYLEAENIKLAHQLGLDPFKDRRNGRWYWPNSNVPLYHSGGIVGNRPTPKQNELMLLAEKGEMIFTEEHQSNLIDALKSHIPQIDISSMIRPLSNLFAQATHASTAPIDATINMTIYATDGDDVVDKIKARKREIADILVHPFA